MLPFDYINTHQAEFWVLVGFALLALESLALGFTSGVVLFGSVGALITGALMILGVLPQDWATGFASFGIGAGGSAILLWKPLKWLQGDKKPPTQDRTSDLIGYEFILRDRIGDSAESETRYSGVNWRVRLDPELNHGEIEAGSRVRVSGVDVGVFWVTRADGGDE